MDYQNYNGEMLFYPIEIFGSHNYFIEEVSVKRNDVVEQSIKFTKVVSNEAIELEAHLLGYGQTQLYDELKSHQNHLIK